MSLEPWNPEKPDPMDRLMDKLADLMPKPPAEGVPLPVFRRPRWWVVLDVLPWIVRLAWLALAADVAHALVSFLAYVRTIR